MNNCFNILLVDDDNNILELNRMILENTGYSVDVANNAESAFNLVCSGSYDLVILDFFMPDMNGDKLVEKIKDIDDRVKFVLVTGSSDRLADLEVVIGERGKVLIKPVPVRNFIETITQLTCT